MTDKAPSMGEITHISNDGEWTYPDTNAAYVLSHKNRDWCQAVIRAEDGEPLGSDGWQQMLCPEDATFTRDLRWIVPELNRVAAERDALSHLLGEVVDWLGVPDWDGPQLPDHLARRIAEALDSSNGEDR